MTHQTAIMGLAVAFPFLIACGPSERSDIKGEIIQKIARPENDVLAIVTRYNGGATVSFAYRVYLSVPESERPPAEILLFDKGAPPNVIWQGRDRLMLKVPCGQIYDFTNFSYVWPQPHNNDLFERIVISLENHGVCKDG